MIRAITFDLDGVYFVYGKSNFIANLGKLGVPEQEVKRVFLQSDEMNKLYKTGKRLTRNIGPGRLKSGS